MNRTVRNPDQIPAACRWLRQSLEKGLEGSKPCVVRVTRQTRNLDQNAKLWAILGDIARQVEWYGQHYDADTWKVLLMHGLGKEQRIIPAIGGGIISIPHHSSTLTVGEMSDLIEYIQAFGSEQGVRWTAPERYE